MPLPFARAHTHTRHPHSQHLLSQHLHSIITCYYAAYRPEPNHLFGVVYFAFNFVILFRSTLVYRPRPKSFAAVSVVFIIVGSTVLLVVVVLDVDITWKHYCMVYADPKYSRRGSSGSAHDAYITHLKLPVVCTGGAENARIIFNIDTFTRNEKGKHDLSTCREFQLIVPRSRRRAVSHRIHSCTYSNGRVFRFCTMTTSPSPLHVAPPSTVCELKLI